MRTMVAESIQHVDAVIRESARNSERLVDLKSRLVRRNAEENLRFDQIKNGNNGHSKKKDT